MLATVRQLMFMDDMILNCPNCASRYVVPDNAIGIKGRQVRCANCKHSWFQESPPIKIQEVETPPIAIAPKSAVPNNNREATKETARTEPKTDNYSPQAATNPDTARTVNKVTDDTPKQEYIEQTQNISPRQEAEAFDEDTNTSLFSKMADHAIAQPKTNEYMEALSPTPPEPFAPEPPFKPRRNPAKLWTMAAISFALILTIIAGGLWYSGMFEGSLSRETVTSELELVLNDNHEINETQDGRRFVIASGTIINPTQKELAVPDMLAILLDGDGRELYYWEIPAPVATLGPGAKVEFSGAARDNVPRAASDIAIDWKGSR